MILMLRWHSGGVACSGVMWSWHGGGVAHGGVAV